ncbi:MAG: tetratricopeptide repeat protein [Acidobacteriota bacterium]
MVSMTRLKKSITFALAVMAICATAASAEDRREAKSQVEFGIKVAEQGLWKEAIYRWERAVELDPSYAAAFNNLAVAYETAGLFDKAKKAYERALELDPKNVYIRQNFDLFKEINDRANRKPSR